MFTTAPEITVDATVGQVVVASPAPTPTLSPAGPPMSPPYYFIPTPIPTGLPQYPKILKPRRFTGKPLTIYGFGPINSEVSLRGFGVSEKTTSDVTGFFRFSEIYSFTYTYPELCLQSVDDKNRVTQPTCIPPLPNNSIIPLEVGPILLSPTLSLTDNRVTEGDMVVLDGKTTPNTLVNVYLSKNNKLVILNFVKEAKAYSLPVVNTESDEVGNYEISLPTSDQAEYKVFTSTKFGENFSAKSNTLKFAVVTGFKTWLTRFIDFILANKMMIVIIAEAVILIILFILALKSTTKRKRRHTERDYLEAFKL